MTTSQTPHNLTLDKPDPLIACQCGQAVRLHKGAPLPPGWVPLERQWKWSYLCPECAPGLASVVTVLPRGGRPEDSLARERRAEANRRRNDGPPPTCRRDGCERRVSRDYDRGGWRSFCSNACYVSVVSVGTWRARHPSS